tara:strand:+ start:864 stop:1079 length:216 start_codon:yes stop_codon:yes gene_type:complete
LWHEQYVFELRLAYRRGRQVTMRVTANPGDVDVDKGIKAEVLASQFDASGNSATCRILFRGGERLLLGTAG